MTDRYSRWPEISKRSQKAQDARAGTTYFVAANGSDANPGTLARPFATLYRAYQAVAPGDTVNIRGGVYQTLISWNKGGSATAPITIQAYHGEDVTLYCSEQYPWTRVMDRIFGDCWKATIPDLPIRYRGLQHTVWEDAVSAIANPNVQIRARS